MPKWLIIDGYNMVFRGFHAIPHLSRSDGLPTNAIHGWVRTIWKLQDMESPDEMMAVFDMGEDPQKRMLLPEYKAQRAKMPQELVQQVPSIKELTCAMGLDMIEIAEVEADDVIGSYAAKLSSEGHLVTIVSADKDLAQCVRAGVTLLWPPPTANPSIGWRKVDAGGVEEKFGVPPDRVAEYLALVGDSVDNIPGIPGIGPKTAAKWLQQYGSLQGALDHLDEIKPERFREKMNTGRPVLARNLQLTTLNCSLPLPSYEKNRLDTERLFRLLADLEMKTHLKEARKRYAAETGELNLDWN